MLNLSDNFKLKKISNFYTSFSKKYIDNSTQTPTKLFQKNINNFSTNISNNFNSCDYSFKLKKNCLDSEFNNFIIKLIKSKELNNNTYIILKNFTQKYKIIRKKISINNFILKNNKCVNFNKNNLFKSKSESNFLSLSNRKLMNNNNKIKEIEEYNKKNLFENLRNKNFKSLNKNIYKNKILQKIVNI